MLSEEQKLPIFNYGKIVVWRVSYFRKDDTTLHDNLFTNHDFSLQFLGGGWPLTENEEFQFIQELLGTKRWYPQIKSYIEMVRIQKIQLDFGRDENVRFKETVTIIGNWTH